MVPPGGKASNRRLRRAPAWGAALAVALWAGAGHAQIGLPRLPGPGLPGGPFEQLPEIQPGLPAEPGLVLPPIPTPAPGRLSTGPRVFIREVRVEGNTVLSEAELRAVVDPFLNQNLTAEDLQTLRQALTLAYVNRGYINSGAVLPDQEVSEGVVVYRIVEGVVTDIEIAGNERLREDYIRNRLARDAGPPLNIGRLERRLQLMLQDPLIEQMNVEVRPGLRPGEARLAARVVEANPYSLTASIANSEPPSVGGIKGEIAGTVRNLTGWGDVLSLRYGRTEGLNSGGFYYAIPVTADDTILSFRYDINDSTVVEEPFKDLDIDARSDTIELGISHPVWRTPQQSLTLGLTLAKRKSETSLLGEPFSFTPGVVDGEAKVTVLRFSQDFIDRSPDQVLALRSTFSFGLDWLDATVSGVEPDSRFKAWLGQAQYVRRIFGEAQLVARADLQLTDDPLFPLEQFPVGGFNTVRGYRENQLVRDNAFVASIEGRVPIFKLGLPFVTDQPDGGQIQLAGFFDYGNGWNRKRGTPDPRDIASVGLGLRFDLGSRLQAALYYGYALRDIDNPDKDIQDSGIHFRILSRLY